MQVGAYTFVLGAGETRQQQIVLPRGGLLQVRVNDSNGWLPAVTKFAAPNLIIGVMTANGAFHAAGTSAVDRGGRTLTLAVPFSTPLTLWVFTRHFSIMDDQGNTVNTSGTNQVFQIPSGTGGVAFALNILGKTAEPWPVRPPFPRRLPD